MDDVHALAGSAVEDSYLFLVDSRTRDTAVHPTPSEYEIAFASPFRNVFGLDLLDATVARTEFIVEANTNVLAYAPGQPSSLEDWAGGAWARGRAVVVALDPGDYNLPQLVEHMNAKLAAATTDAPLVVRAVTNPAEVSNAIRISCSQPFTLLMDRSTLRHTLGFGDPVTATTAPQYAAVPGWSVNRTAGASHAFLSRPGALVGEEPRAATIGPLPLESLVSFERVYAGRTLRQFFVSDVAGPPTSVLVYALGVGTPPTVLVRACSADDDAVLAEGTLGVVADDPDSAYVPAAVTLVAAASMVAGAQYYVEFSATEGSALSHVGVYFNEDNLAAVDGRSMALSVAGGSFESVNLGKNACVDVLASAEGHAVTCPGVVNLTGPRYVNIRCPEIESHMFRDRVNEKCHAGLGMINLRGYGFREQRYDFTSFPPRRFHPLGKLSKLTFRLERPDGTLYDSHGVDHTLLLVLRYYRSAGGSFESNRLNPHYTPDLRRHLTTERWANEARANDRIAKFYGA